MEAISESDAYLYYYDVLEVRGNNFSILKSKETQFILQQKLCTF